MTTLRRLEALIFVGTMLAVGLGMAGCGVRNTAPTATLGSAVVIIGLMLVAAGLYQRLAMQVSAQVRHSDELRAQQEQTDIILHHSADGIVLTDPQARIIYVNPAWQRMTGYRAPDVIGKNPSILQSGETPRATYDAMWQTIMAGKIWRGVLHNKRRTGERFEAETTIAPVTDADGTIRHFVGIMRDVTEAHRQAAMRERFIANAAHDLANPIQTLQWQLPLLKMDAELADEQLDAIERQVERLDNLVQDLMALSRLDRGIIDPSADHLDLNAVVSGVVQAQHPLATRHEVRLDFRPDTSLAPLSGDRRHLERAIINLVVNAIHYTPSGGSVELKTLQANQEIMLTVEDTGQGIASDDLPHIFDRFYRGETARATAEGTGLGLAIVREVIAAHKGRIYVDSTPGVGTLFRIFLPIRPPH